MTIALERAEAIYQPYQEAGRAYEYLGSLGELSQEQEIMFWRGWYAAEAGLVDEAEEIYRTLIGRIPNDAWNYNALGYLLAEHEYVKLYEALAWLEKALKLEPSDPDILDSYGFALTKLGYLSEAEKVFTKIRWQGGYDPTIFYNRVVVQLLLGQEAGAAQTIETMYEQGEDVPGNREAIELALVAWVNSRQEIDEEMLASLALAREENPGNPLLPLAYAFALHAQGSDDSAQWQLQAASYLIDANSEPALLRYYSEVLHEMGESEEAERFLRLLISQEPDNPWNYNSLGSLLAEQGQKLEEAVELMEQGLVLAPDRPEILASYGWVLYRQERPAAARAMMERALNSEKEMGQYTLVETLTHHGEILWEMGNEDAAVEAWKSAWWKDRSHDKLGETLARYNQAFE